MKIFAYVSCDSLAYTPACLNTVLAGRGLPPNCPAYANAFPGSGQIQMQQQMIEVSEAADCYEKDAAGKWVPVKDTENNAFVYRHGQELAYRSFFNATELRSAIIKESTAEKSAKLLGAK